MTSSYGVRNISAAQATGTIGTQASSNRLVIYFPRKPSSYIRQALASVHHNAALNGFNNVDTLEGDAFEVLKGLADDKQKFDIVVLDPPALIPRRRDQKAGEQAYARLNQLGLRLLEPVQVCRPRRKES